MKKFAIFVLAATVICSALPLSGCAACSREAFPSESGMMPESQPDYTPYIPEPEESEMMFQEHLRNLEEKQNHEKTA